jgi:hypothetical protein
LVLSLIDSKSKKKKRKAAEFTVSETSVIMESPPRSSRTTSQTSQTPPQLKANKKAIKKAKAREKKAGKDELDQALAELSVKCVSFYS